MNPKPNFLILLADQMQASVLEAGHVCQTPNLDRLAAKGVRFPRAYTPNPVCSPARASLMTGLLPHNHGVLWVTHTVEEDQGLLRERHPHWAQRLREAGYQTAYFGKWHVERANRPEMFGWDHFDPGPGKSRGTKEPQQAPATPDSEAFAHAGFYHGPDGYPDRLQFGVLKEDRADRAMIGVTDAALDHLGAFADGPEPWCCAVSFYEPHDPYICGGESFRFYRDRGVPLPDNRHDDFSDKPNLYRRSAECFANIDDETRRDAAACYYGSITEADRQWGRLLDFLDATGAMRNTHVIFASDHGDLLGGHGMYCKNISAFEEIYNIPLVLAGPGVPAGRRSPARVGLHDIGPTLLELAGARPLEAIDARSFAPVLSRHENPPTAFNWGFAEYHGGRIHLTQRVFWEDNWKFVFNGFDYDELYDLDSDPGELMNLAHHPEHRDRLDAMMAGMWNHILRTRDLSLINTSYPPLRIARSGPGAVGNHQTSDDPDPLNFQE